MEIDRRSLLRTALLTPIALAAGCAGSIGALSVEDGVYRLLSLSSQRAFARLTIPGGFYDDQLTRIVPPASGGDGVLSAVLRTNAVRRQVAMAMNEIAVEAADRAAPIVIDTIRRMSFADALAIARGGPTAATDLLEAQVGDRLIEAMFPEFSLGLSGDVVEILGAIAGAGGGPNYAGLARSASALANRSIFRAIGREEAGIRANPQATRDPAILALLTAGSR
ncbi:DUF4197 family protein [Sphingomonas qomolangmaensis]|uniref:DUF4197 domain-containing protein n=1 Tax=Sphingomonas qomolangmaensis TaxID=2918765 RepID=A0ABY5L9D8_9SPHN|nr:DUF4197 family protein [Sphingomonas qomolangmaensis]UUL83062.1 DUF4197 domain-containing protein [Sphingomonas qomolangmaensis]